MRALTALPLGLLLFAVGCSHGPTVARVTGRVTYDDGKPVTGGQIMFHAEGGRPALADIQPDGTYTLTTYKPGDGALVGKHVVTITATRVGAGSVTFSSPEDEQRWTEQGMKQPGGAKVLVPGKVEWLVPESYSQPQTSNLRAEVKAEENVINFKLKK
jgi:hypothetical protein